MTAPAQPRPAVAAGETAPDQVSRMVRQSRVVALSFGAIILTLTVADAVWLMPWVERHRTSDWSFWAMLGPMALGLVLTLAYATAFARRRWPPPAGFRLGQDRGRPAFLVPNRPLTGATFLLQVSTASTQLLLFGTMLFHWALWLQLAVGVPWFFLQLRLLFQRPSLMFTPESLIYGTRSGLRPRLAAIPWGDFAAGRPTSTAYGDRLWVLVAPAAGPEWTPLPVPPHRWLPIPLGWSFTDRPFLAYAIGFYAVNPLARVTIGTAEGHAILSDSYRALLSSAAAG